MPLKLHSPDNDAKKKQRSNRQPIAGKTFIKFILQDKFCRKVSNEFFDLAKGMRSGTYSIYNEIFTGTTNTLPLIKQTSSIQTKD